MKKSIKKLSAQESEEEGFFLAGILSEAPDFFLCWTLNQELGLELEKTRTIEIEMAGLKARDGLFSVLPADQLLPENLSLHPVFEYEDETMHRMYSLFCNHGTMTWMVPELKNMNYFLKVKGFTNPSDMNALLREMRNLEIISMAVKLEPRELPSRVYFFE
jgi:hypothetical protein